MLERRRLFAQRPLRSTSPAAFELVSSLNMSKQEQAAVSDERLSWLSTRVCSSMKLKPEKFKSMSQKDENWYTCVVKYNMLMIQASAVKFSRSCP